VKRREQEKTAEELSDEGFIALSESEEWVPVGDIEERRRFWKDAARNTMEESGSGFPFQFRSETWRGLKPRLWKRECPTRP
jgi:hypothetical protein